MEGNNDGRFFTEKIVFDNIKLDDELFNNIILFLKSERFYVFDAKTEEDIKFAKSCNSGPRMCEFFVH